MMDGIGALALFLVLIGFFWVIPVGLSTFSAQKKGRSGYYGLLWAFFLGWIGLCVVLMSSDSVEVRVRKEHEEKLRLRALMREDD